MSGHAYQWNHVHDKIDFNVAIACGCRVLRRGRHADGGRRRVPCAPRREDDRPQRAGPHRPPEGGANVTVGGYAPNLASGDKSSVMRKRISANILNLIQQEK